MGTNLWLQEYQRDEPRIRFTALVVFTAAIAVVGAIMMSVTSSAAMKGASFLWLPASLQLIAGVWLGPVRGAIAGGVGAYLAGIMAYGGFGPPDIVNNLIAGGIANAWLPGILFRSLRIDPTAWRSGAKLSKGVSVVLLIAAIAALFAIVFQLFIKSRVPESWGSLGFALPLVFVLFAPQLLLKTKANRHYVLAVLVAILCSFISAGFGVVGTMMTGQPFPVAVFATGLGWFLGDTVSAILGVAALGEFHQDAVTKGIAPRVSPANAG